MSTMLQRIQTSQLDGRAQPFRYREAQFHRLYEALRKSASALKLAIQADSLLSSSEADFELARALFELRTHYESMDLQKDAKMARQVEQGVPNIERTKPMAIVYIVPSRSSLAFSVLSALGAAMASGSCVVLELPETLSQSSSELRRVLTAALDADTFVIVKSRPSSEFTKKCMLVAQTEEEFNPSEWAQVLSSPVLSKAVAIVDRTADIEKAAQTIGEANFSFGGNAAYAPQLVLVNEFVADTFLSGLVSTVARGVPGSGLDKKANGTVGPPQKDRQAPKDLTGTEAIRTVVSGSSGRILEVLDRLDDALTILRGEPLAACFLFADLRHANYLSRYINSSLFTINHIPLELLVGPVAPLHPCIPAAASPRYTPAMFRVPAPQYLPAPHSPQSLTDPRDQSHIRRLVEKSLQPLPPIVQGNGHQLNFFGQAIMVGFGMAVSSVVGVSIGALWLVLGRPRLSVFH